MNKIPTLDSTDYIVEATSFEQMTLWGQYSDESLIRTSYQGEPLNTNVHKWEQVNEGRCFTVGHIGKKPVNIVVTWAYIDGVLVMFYESISHLVDYAMVREWLDKNTKCKDRHCNAQNFQSCLGVISRCTKNRQIA